MEEENDLIDLGKILEFREISKDEKELEIMIMKEIQVNVKIKLDVDRYHNRNERCAIMIFVNYEKKMLDTFILGEGKIKKAFNFFSAQINSPRNCSFSSPPSLKL